MESWNLTMNRPPPFPLPPTLSWISIKLTLIYLLRSVGVTVMRATSPTAVCAAPHPLETTCHRTSSVDLSLGKLRSIDELAADKPADRKLGAASAPEGSVAGVPPASTSWESTCAPRSKVKFAFEKSSRKLLLDSLYY